MYQNGQWTDLGVPAAFPGESSYGWPSYARGNRRRSNAGSIGSIVLTYSSGTFAGVPGGWGGWGVSVNSSGKSPVSLPMDRPELARIDSYSGLPVSPRLTYSNALYTLLNSLDGTGQKVQPAIRPRHYHCHLNQQ